MRGLLQPLFVSPALCLPRSQPPTRKRPYKPGPYDALLSDPASFVTMGRSDGSGMIDLLPASPLLPREIASACRPAVTLGTIKGRDLIPDTSFALSAAMKRGAFPEAEVDAATAIAYLRHEAIRLPDGTPRGIVLLIHQSLPLGFVKTSATGPTTSIGNRGAYLPTHPRRRSSHSDLRPEQTMLPARNNSNIKRFDL